jgi:hypothetical protein
MSNSRWGAMSFKTMNLALFSFLKSDLANP